MYKGLLQSRLITKTHSQKGINKQFTEKVQRPLNVKRLTVLLLKCMLRNSVFFCFCFCFTEGKHFKNDFWLSRVENICSYILLMRMYIDTIFVAVWLYCRIWSACIAFIINSAVLLEAICLIKIFVIQIFLERCLSKHFCSYKNMKQY